MSEDADALAFARLSAAFLRQIEDDERHGNFRRWSNPQPDDDGETTLYASPPLEADICGEFREYR